MTTYILAGTFHHAVYECRQHNIQPWVYNKTTGERLVAVPATHPHQLEGRNILPGDRVLFGHGTTVALLNAFIAQAHSRGTQLSDLEIIH